MVDRPGGATRLQRRWRRKTIDWMSRPSQEHNQNDFHTLFDGAQHRDPGELSMDPELRAALAALATNAQDFHAGVEARLDGFETRLNRPGFGLDVSPQTAEARAARKRFDSFLRHGPEGLEPADRRALAIGDDTTGGYLSPPEFFTEILRNVVPFSPVRLAAKVGQTSAGEVLIPKRTGRMTARWSGETEARVGTEPTYGQIRIPVDESTAYVDVSNKMLDDAPDFAKELAFDFGEEFGRLESESFVVGDGVTKPFGFMSDTDITFTVSGAATDITSDGLIDTLYSLAPAYRVRSSWMLNGSTLAKVRKLKDGNGQYLWQPSIAAGQPETLLSRPVFEAIDMPDTGAGAYPIIVGDFNAGYRIIDRLELSILRDPYSLATTGQTRLHGRRRVGGGVTKAEAFRKVKCST
jgi:HK97 family phage major capsid protein